MNRLRELREQSGLSVQELAQRSEVSEDLIGQLETGQSKTTPEVVGKLTKALNKALSAKNVAASPQDFDDLLETPAADSANASTTPIVASNKTTTDDGEYHEALAAVQSGIVSATNSAISAISNGVKPGVVSQAPSYLSYETKKEAQQAKLFTTLLSKGVPALIILGIFGWIGWQVWQQLQSGADSSEVVLEEPYMPPAKA